MDLNAKNLKNVLWNTLNGVIEGKIQPAEADSVATQAREILRTVNTQVKIVNQAKEKVPTELIDFANNK